MTDIKIDSHGSKGLKIETQDNNSKTYIKQVGTYLYKYAIDYINSLGKMLDIPVMNYDFFRINSKNYIKSESFDSKIDYDEIIIEPIYYDNIYDGIYMLKKYLSNYENGYDTYQIYLKQIVLALLINDSDRTIENIKFYRKNNRIYIAPYFDIHMSMNLDCDYEVFMDEYFFNKQEYEECNGSNLSFEEFNSWFEHDFNKCYEFIFAQNTFGSHSIQDIWKVLIEEIDDKELFEKLKNMRLEDILIKEINENAYKIISEQFRISKDLFLDSIQKKKL